MVQLNSYYSNAPIGSSRRTRLPGGSGVNPKWDAVIRAGRTIESEAEAWANDLGQREYLDQFSAAQLEWTRAVQAYDANEKKADDIDINPQGISPRYEQTVAQIREKLFTKDGIVSNPSARRKISRWLEQQVEAGRGVARAGAEEKQMARHEANFISRLQELTAQPEDASDPNNMAQAITTIKEIHDNARKAKVGGMDIPAIYEKSLNQSIKRVKSHFLLDAALRIGSRDGDERGLGIIENANDAFDDGIDYNGDEIDAMKKAYVSERNIVKARAKIDNEAADIAATNEYMALALAGDLGGAKKSILSHFNDLGGKWVQDELPKLNSVVKQLNETGVNGYVTTQDPVALNDLWWKIRLTPDKVKWEDIKGGIGEKWSAPDGQQLFKDWEKAKQAEVPDYIQTITEITDEWYKMITDKAVDNDDLAEVGLRRTETQRKFKSQIEAWEAEGKIPTSEEVRKAISDILAKEEAPGWFGRWIQSFKDAMRPSDRARQKAAGLSDLFWRGPGNLPDRRGPWFIENRKKESAPENTEPKDRYVLGEEIVRGGRRLKVVGFRESDGEPMVEYID